MLSLDLDANYDFANVNSIVNTSSLSNFLTVVSQTARTALFVHDPAFRGQTPTFDVHE